VSSPSITAPALSRRGSENRGTRLAFHTLDRPALKALPVHPYEYAEWKKVGVNIDYHVSFDDHFYSAPYTLVGETLWCRATGRTIELIHQGKRITSHVRSHVKYDYSTHPEHRPASHRAHLEWTPSRLIEWGRSIGAHTAAVIELHGKSGALTCCTNKLTKN
jgi:hypothetical protein